MVFFITYDLNNEGKDYEGIKEAIDRISTKWCRYWKSSWLIKTNLESPNDVFNEIKPHLDSDDRCIVIEVVNNKQGWLTEKQWKYINEEIFD